MHASALILNFKPFYSLLSILKTKIQPLVIMVHVYVTEDSKIPGLLNFTENVYTKIFSSSVSCYIPVQRKYHGGLNLVILGKWNSYTVEPKN